MTDDREPLTRERLGENLRRAITASGLTQREVAERTEIDETALSKILTGKRNVSSLELALICTATGSDVLGILEADPLHGPSFRAGREAAEAELRAEVERRTSQAVSLGEQDRPWTAEHTHRLRQAMEDSKPCPTCGGDRLRADFTGSGACHVTTEGQNTPVSTPSGPSAEGCTCWPENDGHDGDCGIWGKPRLEGQDATQETQDATEAARRVERYEGRAVRLFGLNAQRAHDRAVAREVGAAYREIADQEQAELRTEVEAWRDMRDAIERDTEWSASPMLAIDVYGLAVKGKRAEAAEARVAYLEAGIRDVSARLLDPTAHVTEGPLIGRIKVELWLRAILDAPKEVSSDG